MMEIMNKKITLDVLAGMIQTGFLDLARQMNSIEERLKELTLRVDAIELHMDAIELRMDGSEKHIDSFEEHMENGFYNVMQELQQIRQLIKQVDTREQVAALEARVDIIEKKFGR
jgi:DNA anti-recombination protein RmuC